MPPVQAHQLSLPAQTGRSCSPGSTVRTCAPAPRPPSLSSLPPCPGTPSAATCSGPCTASPPYPCTATSPRPSASRSACPRGAGRGLGPSECGQVAADSQAQGRGWQVAPPLGTAPGALMGPQCEQGPAAALGTERVRGPGRGDSRQLDEVQAGFSSRVSVPRAPGGPVFSPGRSTCPGQGLCCHSWQGWGGADFLAVTKPQGQGPKPSLGTGCNPSPCPGAGTAE